MFLETSIHAWSTTCGRWIVDSGTVLLRSLTNWMRFAYVWIRSCKIRNARYIFDIAWLFILHSNWVGYIVKESWSFLFRFCELTTTNCSTLSRRSLAWWCFVSGFQNARLTSRAFWTSRTSGKLSLDSSFHWLYSWFIVHLLWFFECHHIISQNLDMICFVSESGREIVKVDWNLPIFCMLLGCIHDCDDSWFCPPIFASLIQVRGEAPWQPSLIRRKSLFRKRGYMLCSSTSSAYNIWLPCAPFRN